MRVYCTYFDRRYLTRGLALYRSLKRHVPEAELWVLALDQQTSAILEELELPELKVLTLATLEAADRELAATRASRSTIEYYFTCTAPLLNYLLERLDPEEVVTYVDADLYFFSDPRTIFDELGSGSILLTEHRFPPELAHREIFGRYNVGLLCFRRNQTGLAAVRWWRERSIEWCYDRVEEGKFAEQRYLDQVPALFRETIVVQNPAAAVAPWNWSTDGMTFSADRLLIGGEELITYHFHGLRPVTPWLYDLQLRYYGRMPRRLRRLLYGPYLSEIRQAEKFVAKELSTSSRGAPLRQGRSGRRELLSALRHGDLLLYAGNRLTI
jgi:hypothetical protein